MFMNAAPILMHSSKNKNAQKKKIIIIHQYLKRKLIYFKLKVLVILW